MDETQKVRENRLRRKAVRQGLRLEKSRRRDVTALDYGGYQLIDPGTNGLVFGELAGRRFGASLDEIEAWLSDPVGRVAATDQDQGKGSR